MLFYTRCIISLLIFLNLSKDKYTSLTWCLWPLCWPSPTAKQIYRHILSEKLRKKNKNWNTCSDYLMCPTPDDSNTTPVMVFPQWDFMYMIIFLIRDFLIMNIKKSSLQFEGKGWAGEDFGQLRFCLVLSVVKILISFTSRCEETSRPGIKESSSCKYQATT